MDIKNTKYVKNTRERGQALLLVVVAITIALAVGVSVSTRTLTSSKRVARTDTASRVTAVAEGGIENLLKQPTESLENMTRPSQESCDAVGAVYDTKEEKCIYNFSGSDYECLKWGCKSCVCGTRRVLKSSCSSCCYTTTESYCQYYECCTVQYNPYSRTCRTYSAPRPGESCVCKSYASRTVLRCNPCNCIYYYITENIMCENDCEKCGSECLLNVTSTEGLLESDTLISRAVVSVEKFSTNGVGLSSHSAHYWFDLDPGYVKEVNLQGYRSSSIRVCWDNPKSALYYIIYSSKGTIKKGGFYLAGGFTNTSEVSGFTSVTMGGEGYIGCRDIDLRSPFSSIDLPYGLRIKVLYNSSRVAVFPRDGDRLPYQGYKITSVGELSTENTEKQTKTVVVYKSFPYAPSVFDYGIYTTDTLN